jgi:hypothetical protein
MNPKSSNSFFFISVLVIALGLLTATAKADNSRKPVSIDCKGNATFHPEMTRTMKKVDLTIIPSDTSVAIKRPATVEGHVVMKLYAQEE